MAATFNAEINRLARAITDASPLEDTAILEFGLTELSDQFEKDILDAYSKMLQKEMEYLMSDECIKESIIAAEYTFNSAGKMINGVPAVVHLLFETDAHKSKQSRTFLGAFSSPEIAAGMVEQNGVGIPTGGDIVLISAELNKFEEQ